MSKCPKRRHARWILRAVLLAAVTALAIHRGAAAGENRVRFEASFEERYDDNIIELSDRDLDRLENLSASSIQKNRFAIDSPDDFVSIPRLSLQLAPGWLERRPTEFSIDANFFFYASNTICNYQSYRVSATQALGPGPSHLPVIGGSLSVVPYYYLRNLTNDAASLQSGIPGYRLEADYSDQEAWLDIDQDLGTDRFRLKLTYGKETRDYNDDFNERDSHKPYYQGAISWTDANDRVRLRGAYRRQNLHAAGDIVATPFLEDDVSQDRDIVRADVRIRWGARGRRRSVSLSYESQSRHYTTGNPLDIYHFGRDDDRGTFGVWGRVGLKGAWEMRFGGEREKNVSHFPGVAPTVFEPSDATDYTRTIVYAGFGYAFHD